MTDKEIRALIEKRKKNWGCGNSVEAKYKAEECKDILELMNEQEEPISEDLMDATNNYCVNVRKGYPRVMDETDRYIYNAFKAGAQWQLRKTRYEKDENNKK